MMPAKIQIIDNDFPTTSEISQKFQVPAGYLPFTLTTKGKLGVPKTIHIRNFTTEEIVTLSLYKGNSLVEKTIATLNGMIYEKVDVSKWPDKSIVEVMILIYINFFTPIVYNVVFPWKQEDIDFLRAKNENEKADNLIKGVWKPTIDVDLSKAQTIEISDAVKSYLSIKKKGSTESLSFIAYPRYGDVLVLRDYVTAKFQDTDTEFSKIKSTYEAREAMIESGAPPNALPDLSEGDFIRWQNYETEKAIAISKAVQALYLTAVNGVSVEDKPLKEKIEILYNNPIFDISLSKKLDKTYDEMSFGINPEIEVFNPITQKPDTRRFSFRVMDIISTIYEYESDDHDISFND